MTPSAPAVRGSCGYRGCRVSLSDVLTIQEVCKFWHKGRSTVRYHVDRGHLRSRCTEGGRYLIRRTSVEALWGPPDPSILDSDLEYADDQPF